MNTAFRVCTLLGVCAALLCVTTPARAQWPYDYGYGGGYNWGFQRYALLNSQMPPYFAMFPPVYYRGPIEARTYGSSPFAYPPCNCQEAVKPPQPTMIQNPYVKPSREARPKSASYRRIEPLVVLNPYVTHSAPTTVATAAP